MSKLFRTLAGMFETSYSLEGRSLFALLLERWNLFGKTLAGMSLRLSRDTCWGVFEPLEITLVEASLNLL